MRALLQRFWRWLLRPLEVTNDDEVRLLQETCDSLRHARDSWKESAEAHACLAHHWEEIARRQLAVTDSHIRKLCELEKIPLPDFLKNEETG